MRLTFTIFAILFGFVVAATSGSAQSLMPTTTTTSEESPAAEYSGRALTPAEADAMVSRLSDEDVRSILLQQLGTAEDGAISEDAGIADFANRITVEAAGSVTEAVSRLPLLVSGQTRAFSNYAEAAGGLSGLLTLFGTTALILLAAYAVERLLGWFTRRWATLPKLDESAGLTESFGFLGKRLFQEAMGLFVFFVIGRSLAVAIIPEDQLPLIAPVIFYLVVLPRLAGAVGRFMMAPRNPAYRIVHTDDRTALSMERHQIYFMVLIGLSIMLPQFNSMNGVPMGETRLGFWLNLAVHLYVAWIAFRYRPGLRMMMRGKDPDVTSLEERIADAYPWFVIAVSLLMWWVVNIIVSYQSREAFDLLRTAPHYKTMVLLIFAPAMDTGIRGIVRHLVPPMTGEGAVAERAYRATKRSYIRIGRVIVFGLVLITIADFWGMSATSIASAGVGERVAASLLEFLMVLSVGYLAYELVSLYINRKLAAEMTASGYDPDNEDFGGDGGGTGGSRLSTVLPLILATARVTIVVVFVLLALSNVGVDTTPLLAGAGIIGLAIGFGAQKLVTDVVSGVFFLVDDAFRTGEYVEVEGTMGTVEKISIRSMQLRHHKGPVHTIPYGEIPKLTNYSRDWVIMKLKFTVPFDTDPNKIKKIFKRIGAEMLEHETLGGDFLQPFKSQGVLEIDDVGVVIRGKFMAKPGKQFMIRKEIFNRVSAAFAENGIDFARREVRVALPGLEDKDGLTEEDKASIAAAASQAAEAAQAGESGKPADDR